MVKARRRLPVIGARNGRGVARQRRGADPNAALKADLKERLGPTAATHEAAAKPKALPAGAVHPAGQPAEAAHPLAPHELAAPAMQPVTPGHAAAAPAVEAPAEPATLAGHRPDPRGLADPLSG